MSVCPFAMSLNICLSCCLFFIYPSSLVHISLFPCSSLSVPLFISLCSLVHISLFPCLYLSVPLFVSLCSLVHISLFPCSHISLPLFKQLHISLFPCLLPLYLSLSVSLTAGLCSWRVRGRRPSLSITPLSLCCVSHSRSL